MNALRIIGVILIVAGVVGLAVGGFSYTKETVNVPLWASIAAIVGGVALLAVGGRKK